MNWKLEGLNQNNEWVLLDKKRNDRSLSSKGAINTFSIQTDQYCKSFKL